MKKIRVWKRYSMLKSNGERKELEQKELISLEEMQRFVGGYIEIIYAHDCSDWIMVLNEEGKLQGLDMNMAATAIAREKKMIAPSDYIAGDAILTRTDCVK